MFKLFTLFTELKNHSKTFCLILALSGASAAMAQDTIYKKDGVETKVTEITDTQTTTNQSNENYALLHFYRPGMFFGCAVWFDIDLEDKEVWRCKSGRKKTIKITKEGPITIHAKTEAHASITIDIELGKEYYIECTIGMGVVVGRPILTLKDESVGLSMFNKIKAKKDDTEL